ncbi:MAG: hydrogenase maturation nickel metallochaperone HypA [bacterium]|nr:hydrogenase maturation nickel metallochaperone HypA [Candidatus Sumerlaeota bacterium]
MHEFSIVQSLVRQLAEDAGNKGADRVLKVRLRRGSTFSEDALLQAFEVASRQTILEGAELIIETVKLDHTCACGHRQLVMADDLIGHMFVCPKCGEISECAGHMDLELIDVIIESGGG